MMQEGLHLRRYEPEVISKVDHNYVHYEADKNDTRVLTILISWIHRIIKILILLKIANKKWLMKDAEGGKEEIFIDKYIRNWYWNKSYIYILIFSGIILFLLFYFIYIRYYRNPYYVTEVFYDKYRYTEIENTFEVKDPSSFYVYHKNQNVYTYLNNVISSLNTTKEIFYKRGYQFECTYQGVCCNISSAAIYLSFIRLTEYNKQTNCLCSYNLGIYGNFMFMKDKTFWWDAIILNDLTKEKKTIVKQKQIDSYGKTIGEKQLNLPYKVRLEGRDVEGNKQIKDLYDKDAACALDCLNIKL